VLLAALQALVVRHWDDRYETADLVHFDFNPANILVEDGTISGVIDWQDPCGGDCAFDLVTLLFYAWDIPAVRDTVWQYLRGQVGPGVLAVYLAHMILRQVDWSIRHHGPQETASWLRIAREALARCGNSGNM
jgi:aminoglycoside phosphotransferase (APT) family kinase protein